MRTRLHRIQGFVVVLLAAAACSSTGIVTIAGNGQSKTERREVAAFDAITVSDSLMATITLAPDQPQSVQLSGDANLLPFVSATVSGNELTLDLASSTPIAPKLRLAVVVSARALHALRADNAAEAVASAVSGDDVSIESSGSADVKVARITAANRLVLASHNVGKLAVATITAGGPFTLTADHSGQIEAMAITATQPLTLVASNVADVAIGGTAPLITAQLSGSASLRGQDLSAASVVITASNVSTAQVCATASLDATLTTSSQVAYHCNPAKVTRSVDQTSTLTQE